MSQDLSWLDPNVPYTLRITDSPAMGAGWYEPSLQCWCHMVIRDGVIQRFTSLGAGGPFEPYDGVFIDEWRFTGNPKS